MKSRFCYALIALSILLNNVVAVSTVAAADEKAGLVSLNYKALEDKIVFTWQEPDGVKETQIKKYNHNNESLGTITVPAGTEYYKDPVDSYKGYKYELCCIYEDGTESDIQTVRTSAAKANQITNWNVFFGGNKPYGYDYAWVEKDTAEFYEGKQSAKISIRAPYDSNRHVTVMQRIAVEPNTNYIMSFYYKASNINGNPGARINLDGNKGCEWLTNTDVWMPVTFNFKTGASKTSIEVQISVLASLYGIYNVGTIWFDDMQLYRADDKTKSNHIKDGGFEGKADDLIMSEGELTRSLGETAQWFVNHGKVQKSKLNCGGRIANRISETGKKAVYLYHGIEKSEDMYSGVRLTIPQDMFLAGTEYKIKLSSSGNGLLYVNGKEIGTVSDGAEYSFTPEEITADTMLEIRLYEQGELWLDELSVYTTDTQVISFDFEDEEETYFLNSEAKGYKYGDETVLYAKVSNDSLMGKDSAPIFAYYKNNELVDVEIGSLYLLSEESKQYYSISSDIDADEVKLLLWNDMKSIVPLNDGAYLNPAELTEYTETHATVEEFDIIIRSMHKKLDELVEECVRKNIPCANEQAAMHIIDRFITYGKEDIAQNFQVNGLYRADYVRDCLVEMYREAKNNLNSYLTGEKTPFESVRYVTGPSESGYKTDLAPSSTGEEKRPTWFVGFGHFADAAQDMSLFSKLGLNMLAHEVLMRDIVKSEDSDGDYNIDYAYISYMKNVLKTAEANNIKVSVLIDVNKFPDWFKKAYPEIINSNGNIENTHPKVREMSEVYVGAVLTVLNEHSDAIHDVCFMNEPASHVGEYTLADFRKWLSVRYDADITKLNIAYGTSYESFDEIPMTKARYVSRTDSLQALNKYYDYLEYNDENFAEYNEYIYEIGQKYAPELRYNIKMLNTFSGYEIEYYNNNNNRLLRGTDPELIANVYDDMNGCDACAYVGSDEYSIRSKFELYDFMTGMNGRPLVNSEDHLWWDSDASFTEKGTKNVRCDVWQGAMHGRTASAIWEWRRSYDSNSTAWASIAGRPDCVLEVAKACNDLNRLAYEVAALNSQKAEAAVYYDKNLIVRKRAAMGLISRSYEALWDCGLKTEFITDNSMDKLSRYKVLVLPSTEYMSEKSLVEVYKYIQNGGKVYIVSDGVGLAYDEHGANLDATLKNNVLAKATKIDATVEYSNRVYTGKVLTPTLDTITDEIMKYVCTFSDVILYDESGSYIKDVEYQSCEYNGDILLSVCNYDIDNPRTAVIKVNGEEYRGTVTDLRTGETMSGAITVDSYNPTILKIEKGAK